MGKPVRKQLPPPTSQTQPYHDDPTSSDAVSLHTTPDDYDYDDAPQLPSYAESETSDAAARSHVFPNPTPIDAPPTDEYTIIREPQTATHFSRDKKPVNVSGTSIRMDARLNDPDALYDYITSYLRHVHPKPIVRLYGYHQATTYRNNKKETQRIVDFDIAFCLGQYLRQDNSDSRRWWTERVASDGDKTHRGTIRKVRAPGSTQDIEVGNSTPTRDLRAWCIDYCSSASALKTFRVSRTVSGLDTELLRQQLEHIVRSTHYRGNLAISFPTADATVDIYSPHWVNRWRISWVRWLFYLSFLWLLTWPVLYLTTKLWSVYTVDWAFSIPRTDVSGEAARRDYASLSETHWLQRHANLIRNLVCEQYHGDATDMPTNVDIRERPGLARLPSTGNINVDSALSFVHGGVSAWQVGVWRACTAGAPMSADGIVELLFSTSAWDVGCHHVFA